MADGPSPQDDAARALRFACSCASAAEVADDPWVPIAKQGKLNDGTKETILNALHRRPRTVAQLAQLLGLSAPTVHRHVAELLASELIHEVDVPPTERGWAVERYYRPAFPVVLAADRQALQPVLAEIAAEVAAAFRRRRGALAGAFARTSLPARGDAFEGLLHYLYAAAVRAARARLEEDGDLPPWPGHRDGSRWVWWAEEARGEEAG